MKRLLLCCLWVIFQAQAIAQTDSTTQKDTTAPTISEKPTAKKLIPFNSYMFVNARLYPSNDNFSMMNTRSSITYQTFQRTAFSTVMEVTGAALSLILNPRTQPYIPPPNRR